MNKYTPKIPAPTKQWQMLELALADLAKVEANPNYHVSMGHWHRPCRHGDAVRCEVCFAGSVMAQTCGTPIDLDPSFEEYPKEWQNVFVNLNNLREGLYQSEDDASAWYHSDHGYWTEYHEDPVKWRWQINSLMKFLQEKDL